MARDGNHKYITRTEIRRQIGRSFVVAQMGVSGQTQGVRKLAEARARKALNVDNIGGVGAGPLTSLRTNAPFGVNHKEYVAVLSADMRGSTALAEKHEADDVFVLIQCFIPLLAFIVRELSGEVIGLRGDGLIAAFGIGEPTWPPCVNQAYEAGMIMIQATREELRPFLAGQGYPTPKGMGAGVDCGRVTMTKIGLGEAVEVTAYGSAVNRAAKASKALDALWMSLPANTHLHARETKQLYTQKRSRLL